MNLEEPDDSSAEVNQLDVTTEVSMLLERLSKLQVDQDPERLKRIAEIARQLEEGTYYVSAEAVALSILQDVERREEVLDALDLKDVHRHERRKTPPEGQETNGSAHRILHRRRRSD